jgi:eukaryotic-like serine/threonine-protein kinase
MATQENLLNNRYQLVSQHGSGGMSVIYRAIDLALGRQVAVKILRPSLTSDPTFLQRFRQEARNVANLQHPNIVTVHDVGQDGNTHYIVMELIEGDDLKKSIRAEAPFAIDRALDIAIKICAGIGYAHRAQLVHADVKPQNVLLVGTDNVKVTDFGIAQALASVDPNERQKVVWGSPHYFSPEQAQGKHPTPASDVYSIGIVMFEMLTGRLPFMGNDQQELALAHIRQAPPHIHEVNPQIPEQLDRIVQKVLSKEPGARYRVADQLGRILTSYRDQGLGKTNNHNFVVQKPELEATAIPAVSPPPQSGPRSPFAPPGSAQHVPFQSVAQTQQNPMSSSPPTMPAGQPYVYDPNAAGYTRPDYSLRETGYYTPIDPPGLDMVTVLLGLIAFIAVIGMILLWFFVFQAYY